MKIIGNKVKLNRPFFAVLAMFIGFHSSYSQSTSVFDANYFNKDNSAPPIKVGKGFHISDIYKQTRSCFTSESSNPNNLTPQQVGGKKTTVKAFYTADNQQYNVFRSSGSSGKVSFLNLFSTGGSKLEEFANRSIHKQERFIFTANVDFGIYSFDDLLLNSEAKALVDQNKLQDFVKVYGTHYISGIRKESSVTVILTKTSSEQSNDETSSSGFHAGVKIPLKPQGSFELESVNSANNFLRNTAYSVSVEINGPAIDQSAIQKSIENILSNADIIDKATEISALLSSAIKDISDPAQSLITQYYYSPFSLYGLDGIHWDEKKQNELTSINKSVVSVYSVKSQIEELLSPNGVSLIEYELYFYNVTGDDAKLVLNKYKEIIPILQKLGEKADSYLAELEKRYNSCSDVYCPNDSQCCKNATFLRELQSNDLQVQLDKELQQLLELKNNAVYEANKPECEKLQKGIITIKNVSINPYYLYSNGEYISKMDGNSEQSFYVDLGSYSFKAVQVSGYVLYATENIRKCDINNICEEVILRVGFED